MIFEALHKSAEQGELILVNNGYLRYHLRRDMQVTIGEILVLPESQGKGTGKQMLQMMLERCPQATSVYAKCPQDLPSNGWYANMGFECEDVYITKTGRKLNCWRLKILWKPQSKAVEGFL